MSTQTKCSPILFLAILACSAFQYIYGGEYPRTLTAYLGTTPVLDGYISEDEYADAEWLTGVAGWHSDTDSGTSSEDSLDLSVKVWYKHDGTYLYFAFDVTDNLIYGTHTERWLPDRNANANNLELGEGGWPWFGDGLEIMMNPSYTWDETKKSVGDGTIWQTICNTHKSYSGGLEYGGLIQGVPLNEYAWTNYENWYDNEHMKASVRIKSEEEGNGYIVEWRISPNPCMQIDANTFVDLSKENKVGINLEFEDLDNSEDGLGSGNLTQFRHVDYMTKLDDYRKNIAKGFATLVLTPEKMNPDSLSTSISEDYESSFDLPASHMVIPDTGSVIGVQAGNCGNNNLVINKGAPADSAQAIVSFLWMNETVYSSFDIIPKQTGSPIHFNLTSEGESVVKVTFEDDSIRYSQNGNSTAWMSYEADTKYRIQIAVDNQGKMFSLDVNGDMLTDLHYHDTTGILIDGFSINCPAAASEGSFLFDNLIIQDEPIDSSAYYDFEDCWDLAYDYEGSPDAPSDHLVIAENLTDVSIFHSTTCNNNSLLIKDTSSNASTRLEVPFDEVTDVVHVQFTVEAGQDTGTVHFDLRQDETSVVKVGLNSNGMIFYYQGDSFTEWLEYDASTKYSFQVIANNQSKEYDLIAGTDTLRNIGFHNGTVSIIDNLTMESTEPSVGDFMIDNLAMANQVLSGLVFPFDSCVELNTSLIRPDAIDRQINLYPNPTNGSLTIDLSAPHPNPIVVTDMYGREVYRTKGNMEETIELDLSDMASGIYLINFKNEQGRFCKMIQIVK